MESRIGGNLSSVLEGEGISIAQFAKLVGTQYSVISHVITGKRDLGIDLARRMAKALNLTDYEFMARVGLIDKHEERYSDEAAITEIKGIMGEFDEAGRESAIAVLRALRDAHRANASRKRSAG